jgi:hypothetical protein
MRWRKATRSRAICPAGPARSRAMAFAPCRILRSMVSVGNPLSRCARFM